MTEKILIIGGGPAGYTAAIYAARAALSPLLIEGAEPGGQLMITTDVDNYPGFSNGIKGPELMTAMREQAARLGARIEGGRVVDIDLTGRPFKIVTEEKTVKSDTVIIATGATARWLGIPSEKALMGKGVSACATCDGFFFRKKDVVVVGGGDTAIEEAIYLANLANSVKVIHRRDELRATKAMRERVFSNPKISFIWNHTVHEIKDVKKGAVTAVSVKDVKSGKITDIACDGVFIAIGHEPNTAILKGKLSLDSNGYVVTQKGTANTSVEGVFAAGDVADPVYRQAITAAGSGCMAAIDAERWLAKSKN